MKFSKKAQIIGQAFIFILAAVLAVLIIAYGYKAISTFVSQADEISFVSFKTDLEKQIRIMASDFGSVKKLELQMPGSYQLLCLVDLEKRSQAQSSNICNPENEDYIPEVCDAWETSGSVENVFLIPIKSFKVSAMEIPNGYLCVRPKANKIILRLEGKGDKTLVDEWR